MKKCCILIFAVLLIISTAGCGNSEPKAIKTYNASEDGTLKTYYEMSDGTWKCDEYSYAYRLEISGRLNNAASDSMYVYLSNEPEISFDRAWKAAGLSSNMDDYFLPRMPYALR